MIYITIKKSIPLLLSALLLCSCGAETAVTTETIPGGSETTSLVSEAEKTVYPDFTDTEFTGKYFTGTPAVALIADFGDAEEITSPAAVRIGFVKSDALSAEINEWLDASLSSLAAVRGDYISDCAEYDGFDKAHGSIYSRTTYETCEIQAINGFISITLGYKDNRAGLSDNVTAWYSCRTAVYDLVAEKRINIFSELFSDSCNDFVNKYINSTLVRQLESTESAFPSLGINGDYTLPTEPELFTLSSVITEAGEWSAYGLELPLGYKYIEGSYVWRERDFGELVSFTVSQQKIGGFGFIALDESETRYVIPESSTLVSDAEIAGFAEKRFETARELVRRYTEVCGHAPEKAVYSCYSGEILCLRVGGESGGWFLIIKEDGSPLTLADCLCGGGYKISTVYQNVTITEDTTFELSEYFVYSYYEKPETIYFNAWSFNETAEEQITIMDITAERDSVSEYSLARFVGAR